MMALTLLAALIGATGPVLRPRLAPLQDATILYDVTPPDGRALEVRAEIAAGGTRLRLTASVLPAPILIDRASGTGALLVPFLRAYAPFGLGRIDPHLETRADARFTPAGPARQAGLTCQQWRVEAGRDRFTGCVTADGLILRAEGAPRGQGVWRVAAVSVARGALPADIFRVPGDFRVAPVPVEGFLEGVR